MDIAPYRRLQLTLFVPEPAAVSLDACRQRLDPAMASRIRAHLTVLRWIPDLDALESVAGRQALASCRLRLLDVRRAPPEHGGGVYVAIDDANGDFDRLLSELAPALGGDIDARQPLPHITLLHPRTTTDEVRHAALAEIPPNAFVGDVEIRHATLIGETRDQWIDLKTYELA